MAARAKKTKSKPAAAKKKPAAKKKVASMKKVSEKNLSPNGKTHLKTYKDLERRLGETWQKLCQNVEKLNKKAIAKDRDELMLLLGECDYMIHEYEKCAKTQPKRKTR